MIARLDIKGPNLVKGVRLEGLRVLGKPHRFAKAYYRAGIDELMLQDVVATLYERNSLHDVIRETAATMFVPLCVGGGLRTLDDIRDVLRAGADKVCVNTAAVRDPDFIGAASRRFGSSTIVGAVEAIRGPDGGYRAFTDNGREKTGLDAVEWAERLADQGVGELLITSVDREGTGSGFEVDLARSVKSRVGVPVIAHGGAGAVDDVVEVVQRAGVDAVACASILHYGVLDEVVSDEDEFDEAINLAPMRSGQGFGPIRPGSVAEIRGSLLEAGVRTRSSTEVAA